MYIGTDTTYYSGTLTGIRNKTWGNIISLTLVYQDHQIINRPYMSEVHINYLKRKFQR